MSDLISYLFATNAFKVCEEDKPFWLTSGKLSPYFINGQFLYGDENYANELLDYINNLLENTNKTELPKNVFEKTLKQYNENNIYKYTINEMKKFIEENINLDEIDYISGGERRDWYFSNILAYLLNKPHITIFKNLETIESNSDFSDNETITKLKGKKVLHISDLLTVGSSYTRFWNIATKGLGSNLVYAVSVIDRLQGGTETLKEMGIKPLSLLQIDSSLFEKALELGIINKEQLEMLNKYKANPDETMREFLIQHPEFLENALNSDKKTAMRARDCIDKNLYNL